MEYLYIIQQAIVWIITIYWLYQLVVSICSLVKLKDKPLLVDKNHKFMAILPAHNEEAVIGNLIESLKRTDNLVSQANGDARSLIMTKENGKIVGYETNVSTMSIAKRAEDNKNRKGTLLGGFYNGKI